MKRTLLGIIGSCAFTLALTTQAAITMPNGGENWVLGSRQSITWSHDGANAKIKFQLYRGRTRVGVIVTGRNLVDGSYSWVVGALNDGTSAPSGSDYSVRMVRQSDNVELDTSDAPFTIAGQQEPPSRLERITVVSPNGRENWPLSSTQLIRWTSSDLPAGATVDVELLKQNIVKGKIGRAIPASAGSMTWIRTGVLEDGNTVAAGSDYTLRIKKSSAETIFDFSDATFTISDAQPQGPQPDNLPDLQVIDLFPDNQKNLVAKIRNNGPAPFAGTIWFHCWENENSPGFEIQRQLALVAGETRDVGLDYPVQQAEGSCGMHYSVFIDSRRSCAEIDESNNSLGKKIYLNITDWRLLARFVAGKPGHTRIITPSSSELLITPAMVEWPIQLTGRVEHDRCILPLEFIIRNCGTRADLLPASLKFYQFALVFPSGFKDIGRFSQDAHVEPGSLLTFKTRPAITIQNPSTLRICFSEHFTQGEPFFPSTHHEQFNCIEIPLRFEGFTGQ
jgi:hypothetical protein